MRAANFALLASGRYDVYWRLWVGNFLLNPNQPVLSATWGADAEQLASQGQLTLAFGARLINTWPSPGPGRYARLETAVVAKGVSPGEADYRPAIEGPLDASDAGGERSALRIRDLMGELLDTTLEPSPTEYGYWYPGGTILNAMETVRAYAGLTGPDYGIVGLGNYTSTMVVPYYQDAGVSAAEAMSQIALNAGLAFHYRYSQDGAVGLPQARLCIYDPNTVLANVFAPYYPVGVNEIISIQKCTIDRIDVRNAIELIYGVARDREKQTDAASIGLYGRRYEGLSEDKFSQIDTLVEAQREVATALAGQKNPVIELDYERLYFPCVELADQQSIPLPISILPRVFDVRVTGWQHTLTPKAMRTAIRTSGTGKIAGRRWRNQPQRMTHASLDPPVGVAPERAIWLTPDDIGP